MPRNTYYIQYNVHINNVFWINLLTYSLGKAVRLEKPKNIFFFNILNQHTNQNLQINTKTILLLRAYCINIFSHYTLKKHIIRVLIIHKLLYIHILSYLLLSALLMTTFSTLQSLFSVTYFTTLISSYK